MKDFKLDTEPQITSGFAMPDGYFDTFSVKILTQLPQQNSKTISIFSSRKTWYFVAAATVVLLLSVPLLNHYSSNTEEVDAVTLENYLASNSGVSEEEIVKLLNQEDLEKIKVELNVPDKEIEEALDSNSNLEQYILD
jgi:hypothetical protein